MGMNVYGLNPIDETGRYFQASIWEWRPIHDLLEHLGSDLVDRKELIAMTCKEGAGIRDQTTCDRIAARLDGWLTVHKSGHALEGLAMSTDLCGRQLHSLRQPQLTGFGYDPAYYVSREMLEEWGTFLRHCGGFEIW